MLRDTASIVSLAAAAVGYPALHLLIHRIFRSRLSACNGVSLFHASIVTAMGARIASHLYYSGDDLLSTRHRLSPSLAYLEILYIVQDTISGPLDSATKVHHLLAIFGSSAFLYSRKGDFYLAMFALTNSSTVFLYFRYFAKLYGYNLTLPSILFAVSFLVSRVFLFPFLFHTFARTRKDIDSLFHVPFHIPRICTASTLAFASLNLYWFILILAKAFSAGKFLNKST